MFKLQGKPIMNKYRFDGKQVINNKLCVWIERLNDEGEPIEDYCSIGWFDYNYLKDNGVIQ
jgi:hypothetical protein